MALSSVFKIRCSPAEKAEYERAARDAGMTLSEWLRQSLNRAAAPPDARTSPARGADPDTPGVSGVIKHAGFSGTPVEPGPGPRGHEKVTPIETLPEHELDRRQAEGPLASVHPALADLGGKRSYKSDFKRGKTK